MKQLLFAILLTFGLTAIAQDTINLRPNTERIAILNDTKDTLYVVSEMYEMVLVMWEYPKYDLERPTIVPVISLTAYRKEY